MYQSWRRPFSMAVPRHELPDALGFGARERIRLERALDERHIRQVERQAFGAEDALNHREVLAAALHAFFDEVVQASLEQLDIRQHPLVERDRNVVSAVLQVRLHGRLEIGRRRQRAKCRGQRKKVVNGGRLVLLLGEPVALSERLHFVGADPVDQAIEMLADSRLGAPPYGDSSRRSMARSNSCFAASRCPLFQRRPSSEEAIVRGGDQRDNRVDDGRGWLDGHAEPPGRRERRAGCPAGSPPAGSQ